MQSFTGFLTRLFIFSTLVFGLMTLLEGYVLSPKFIFAPWWVLVVFMMGVTLVFHWGLSNAAKKSSQHFIRFFMGATAARLFLFMIILIGYSLFNKITAVGFIINFFILYLLYTAFEVASIYKQFSGKEAGR